MESNVTILWKQSIYIRSLYWTKKWICSNLPMSKDVVNMIANLKQMWWRPYLLTFVSKYGLHHVYPLVNIIFDTYLLICKDEQIHFFMQCWCIRLCPGDARPEIFAFVEQSYCSVCTLTSLAAFSQTWKGSIGCAFATCRLTNKSRQI